MTHTIAPALRLGIRPSRWVFASAIALLACDSLVMVGSKLRLGSRAETIVVLVGLALLRALLRSWLRPGYLRALRETWRGEDATFDTVMGPVDTFVDVMICHFVSDVVITMSVLAGAVPGAALVLYVADRGEPLLVWAGLALACAGAFTAYLYAWLGVRFAEHAVVLDGFGAWRALGRSWRAVRGHRLTIAKVTIATSTIELLTIAWGLACFGVGVAIGVPLGRVVTDYTAVGMWLDLRKGLEPTRSLIPAGPVSRPAWAT